MNADDEALLKNTRILTEHFGFQPIVVIDDIINVINEIMYRCTEQLEQILIKEKNKEVNNGGNLSDATQEILNGTATLESFLEHTINKNFDKFELYALRNVFNLPSELVNGGTLRLKHQEHLDIKLNDTKEIHTKDLQMSEDIVRTIKEIKYQIELNKILCSVLERMHGLLKISKAIKLKVKPLIAHDSMTIIDKKALNELTPLNDTILFLITQIHATFEKIKSIQSILSDNLLISKFVNISKEEERLNSKIEMIVSRISQQDGTEPQSFSSSTFSGNEDLMNFFKLGRL